MITVRDFTQVFDACAQFDKSIIAAKMETMEEEGGQEEGWHIFILKGWTFYELFP